MALPRAHAEKVGLNSTQWGYNKPELILGSSHLRIQSSHLVITFSAGLHSSHGRNLQPSLLHFAILCLSFLYTRETIIFILRKNLVGAPILVWVGLLKEKGEEEDPKRAGERKPLISCAFSEFNRGVKLQRWQKIKKCGGNRRRTCWRNIPLGILQHKSSQRRSAR